MERGLSAKGGGIVQLIFSTEMVKAILEGRKTQTRRVIEFRIAGDAGKPSGKALVS